MEEAFSRTAMLLGEDGVARLGKARVAVFGLGGVGGYVVEALARGGIGGLDLIDKDSISPSNLNRQILATHSTLGMLKTEAARLRVAEINPACQVRTYPVFYLPDTASQFDLKQYDYLVDAMDTVTAKLTLAQQAAAEGVPLISCMGTGNKLHPECLRVGLLEETQGCPLARVMRRECRRRGLAGVRVVYSTEPPRAVFGAAENAADAAGADSTAGPDAPQRPGRPKRNVPGSVSFVPGAAGLLLAAEVVRALAGVE